MAVSHYTSQTASGHGRLLKTRTTTRTTAERVEWRAPGLAAHADCGRCADDLKAKIMAAMGPLAEAKVLDAPAYLAFMRMMTDQWPGYLARTRSHSEG